MTLPQHLLFLLCAATAGYVQNLTGFAFGLVLLGLVGLLGVASIADVANVVSVLTLVNAIVLFCATRPKLEARILLPTMAASQVGVVAGVLLVNWLSSGLVVVLSLLLGLTIIACAGLLARTAQAQAQRSSATSFMAVGAVSGVLGGMFSTAGPPLVYHLYRQPLPLRAIRDTLVAIFAANAVLRLGMMLPAGHVSSNALLLSLETVPLVLLQTGWMARHPSRLQPATVKRIVCVLLALVGFSLVATSLHTLHIFR
ncbi:putative sulfite/organosulfonate exporter TauE [Comamonadaceae bacterium OS-1]|nr:putative sulfite/organosulfonate exporter TauE [Comamonadaceae bacterium OS-1]